MTKAAQTALFSALLAALAVAPGEAWADGPFRFHSLTPCRIVDTRNPNGPKGGPALQSNVKRDFPIQGECGVPNGAAAVSLNVTAVSPTGLGWVTIWPSGQPWPLASTLNFVANDVAVANGAIVALSSQALDLSVLPHVSGNGVVHLILDVTGYFD